ncbi:unnamed protein product [Clonostachys rhizophaga]|uniref:Uncharacterized protein n=1 Tax=Clonostachys rhizophaga TaxID=160324 RepID=A0A9N9VDS0_9HYPO|nr:unnamed protein product [Clonostachys rhizophaga]
MSARPPDPHDNQKPRYHVESRQIAGSDTSKHRQATEKSLPQLINIGRPLTISKWTLEITPSASSGVVYKNSEVVSEKLILDFCFMGGQSWAAMQRYQEWLGLVFVAKGPNLEVCAILELDVFLRHGVVLAKG